MNISPELWYVIASVAAMLVVQAAHSRGIRLPLVESILDWIVRNRPAMPLPGPMRLSGSERLQPEVSQSADGTWMLHWRESKSP